jgi:predicted dehydrogenase
VTTSPMHVDMRRSEIAVPTLRPKLGFLGVGWIGRHRMQAIVESGVAEVVGLCDPSANVAMDAARSVDLGAHTVVASFEALLDSRPDGIVIATPSAMHADQAIAALERGIAVFCQKPLARTAEETERVVRAARASGRLLGVDLSYRFTRGMLAIRDLVRSGELGDVYAIDLVFHNAYGPDKAWFFDPVLSGGGCVIDLGIHLVDLALWTLGFPRVENATSRLYSRGHPLASAAAVEDYAVARLDLETGTTVQLSCSWNLPAGWDAVIGASFYGSEGGAALRNVNGSFFDLAAERFRGTQREVLASPPDDWGGRAAVDWARRLGAGGAYDPEIEHMVDVASALDRIYGR